MYASVDMLRARRGKMSSTRFGMQEVVNNIRNGVADSSNSLWMLVFVFVCFKDLQQYVQFFLYFSWNKEFITNA